jgi:1-acyl-sn-glycerol-3-phosphate acyltransferase
MMLIRNLLFYLGLIPVTIILTILGSIFFFMPYKVRYRIVTAWSHFFIFWAKITCGLNYQIKGLNHLPTHNAIVFSNHQSMWETIFMQVLLPYQAWVLKKELLRIPVFGWGLALIEPIAINRKSLDSIKELIRQGKKYLQAGRWVIIFPEGTRVAPGRDHRYSRSGAALAESTGFPVVPIAHNAGQFWPRGFFIKKPGTIQVVIGPIIHSKGKSATDINAAAEHWIKKKVSELISL